MANNKRVDIQFGYSIDKNGLNELQKILDDISVQAKVPGKEMDQSLQNAAKTARQLSNILDKSFNKDLGSMNVAKLNQELVNTHLDMATIKKDLENISQGSTAFNILSSSILSTNVQIKNSNKMLDKMAVTLGNVVRYGISSSIFNNFANSFQRAYNYTRDLNESLNNIRIITDASANKMEQFAVSANEASKKLGASTLAYTDAALIYYQQGLSDEEARARAEVTLKAANVTGQSAQEVSEQLTAVWNGYKVTADEAELYVDKLAAVAATTAADLEELSTGMSKVASAANIMGVDVDQLNAQLATIVSVTKQAPESVGTALKTIYARMGDIESGISDETTLGNYTKEMAAMGVNVLDMNGKLRDMGEVIEEIGNKWTDLSREQQIALSQTMAGTRQYNNLLALFDSWGMYTNAIKTSQEAVGTLQHQQDIYMESTEAHLKRLQTTWEDLYDSAIDDSEVNAGIDLLTNLIQTFDNFIDSFGGGVQSLLSFGSIFANVFNKQISGAITNFIQNQSAMQQNIDLLEKKKQTLQAGSAAGVGNTPIEQAELANTETQLEYAQRIREVEIGITQEQYNQLTNLQTRMGLLEKEAVLLEEQAKKNLLKTLSKDEYKEYTNFLQEEATAEDNIKTAWVERITLADKAIQSAKDNLKIQQESSKELEKQFNALKESKNIAADNAKIQKTIEKIANSSASDQAWFLKQDTTGSAPSQWKDNEKQKILQYTKEIIEAQKQEIEATEASKNAIEEKNKIVLEGLEARNRAEGKRVEEGQLSVEFDNTMDYANRATDIAENVIMVTGTLSTMATTWSYINSLFQTWTDENASLEDKITQSIMTMSMVIPSLVTAFKNLKGVADLYNLSRAKTLALQEVETKLTEEEIAGLTTEQIVKKAAQIVDEQGVKISEKELATRLTNMGLLKAEPAAHAANTVAKTAETGATITATKAQNALNASIWAFPGTWLVAGLAAVVGAIAFATSAIAKHNEEVKKSNTQAIERENAIQAEIDKNKELYKSYNDLYDQYKKGNATKEQLNELTNKLSDNLKTENSRVNDLTKSYEELDKEIRKSRRDDALKGMQSAQNELNKAGDNVVLAARKGKGYKASDNLYSVEFDQGLTGADDEAVLTLLESYFANNPNIKFNKNSRSFTTGLDAKSIVELSDELKAAQDKIRNIFQDTPSVYNEAEIFNDITKWLEKSNEEIEIYKKSLNDFNRYSAEFQSLNLKFSTDNLKVFREERERLIEFIGKLKGYENTSPEVIANIADSYVQDFSENAAKMLEKAKLADSIAKNFTGENKQKIDESLEQLTDEEAKVLGKLFKDNVITIDENTSLEEMQKYINRAKDIAKYEQANMLATYANDIYTALSQDKALTADQQKEVQKLETEYIELANILDKNSNEYLDKLIQIREQEEENAVVMKQAMEAQLIDKAFDVKVQADTDEYNKVMAEIAKTDYEALVTIQADLQSDFDSIISILDNVENMASKIGDDFIVAAQDLEELNNAFPGIVNNMKLLNDGTAQLNEESVKGAMEAANAEIEYSQKSTIERLQDQQDLLLSKQQAAQTIADLAKSISKGEKDQADVQGEINEALNTLKQGNTETEANFEKDTQVDIAETASDAATSMQHSYAEALAQMNKDQIEWAKSAQKNLWAGMTGIGNITTANINTQWSSTSTAGVVSNADKGQLKSEIDVNTKIDTEAVAEYYQQLANAYGKGAANLQGKIAEIYARNNKWRTSAENIGRGLGSDGKSNKTSGGSSGGSSKAKTPGIDEFDKELNRYHDIDIELTNIQTSMKRLDDEQKKLFGKDLIANINEEIVLLNKQIDTTTRKMDIMEDELKEMREDMSREYGFAFDAEGYISNYNDIIGTEINAVKELSDLYNRSTAEEQEAMKENLDKRKKYVEELINIAEKYDTKRTKDYEDLVDDRQKALDEITTKNIQNFNMEVEIRLDMAEAERDWNKFKREIIDGLDEEKQLARFIDARLADFSSYYAGNGEGSIASLTKQVNSTLVELQKMDAGQANVYGNNRTQGLEDLKKWYTELMKNLEDVQSLEKEIHESYIKMQDQAQKKFDEQVETFELIGDLIDHDMKVIQLVYGEDSYSALDKYYQKQENNNNQQLDFYRRQVEFWQKQMDAAEKSSEAWENAKEKWEDAIKSWKDLIIDSIEDLQDRYLNTINNIFDKLNDNITNGLGLEYVNEQWNLINKNADQYLDNINALYETQALENKYLDAIDKTDSVGAQRQLKELMDAELKDLRERDKLTQYDVERANKKYEIALKQIALQEAQQNKTKMRLRRDSQGNYRYEYTSDGNQIDQMQDEINNMYNSLYNFDKARYQENLGQIYDAWSEFQEKMAEAAQINDPQERAERELLLQEQYGELINGLVEQNSQVRLNLQESAFEDLSRLYDEDSKAYQDMVNMETDALMNQLVPQWESGVQQMADNFAGNEGFLGVCKQAFEELHNATNDYENKLDELERVAGEDFDSIYRGIDNTIEVTEDLLTSNDELIGQYKDQLTAIGDVITELDRLKTKYNEVAEAAKKAVQAGYEYQSEKNKQAADAARAGVTGTSPENSSRPSEGNTSDSNSDTKSGLAGVGDGNLIVGESATYTGKYYYDSFGTAPVGSRYSGVANGIVVDRITNNPYGIHIHSADGKFMDLGWIKKSQLSGYDTGGYTGAWGNDGRLALLHQKELVLNANDTENMLNAVTIMRDITSVLGTSVLNRLANIAAAGANGINNGGLLDQNVHIEATFPGVTNSREIENAFNNLVNMAAMRANRKGN